MRSLFRLTVLLLCLMLVISGCAEAPATTQTSQSASTTQSTTQTVPSSTASTQPENSALASYQEALAQLLKSTDLRMNITRKDSFTVNGETFDSTTHQVITYFGLGTDGFTASVSETATYGEYETTLSELYTGGTAYVTCFEGKFSAELTAEEFTARYLPAELLDASLYTSCTAADGLICFQEGTALEDWLEPNAEFLSAQASVKVSPDGLLESITYTAAYRIIGAEVHTQITVDYFQPKGSITAPSDPSGYVTVSCIDAPRLMERGYLYLLNGKTVSGSSMEMTVLQATGVYSTNTVSWDTSYAGGSLGAKITTKYHVTDNAYNETFDTELEECFLNNRYTVAENGGEPTVNRGVTAQIIADYISEIADNTVDYKFFTSAKCTDLGSLLLLEFTCNSEFGQLINETACERLYGNPSLLDDYATSYRTVKAEYYFAIDKYLGLPTAMGINFEGEHIIDGMPYKLIYQLDQSLNLASLDAYKNITDEALIGAAPETPATPLFYKVTGPQGQTLWLLGTIHVGDDRNAYLPQEILDAYGSSDALAVECDPESLDSQVEADPSLQQLLSDAYYYSDGSTAQDHIEDPELYTYALQLMKATGNHNYNTPYLKVAAWSNSISNFFLQQSYSLSSDKGVDSLLLDMAKAENKPIYEVESSIFQIQMLMGWSEALSQALLMDAVSSDGIDYRSSILELYELWCSGDEAALKDYLTDDTSQMTDEERKLYEEYNKAMSWDRNTAMVDKAIAYLESGETIFYAVGLAHVIADDGLVNGLRAAGYTVELVEFG